MIWGITLILLSILAVPSLILAKRPDARQLLEKIEPYQGWIGLIFCFWGIWGVIQAVIHIGALTTMPIWWLTWLAGSALEAVLGFMLGYTLIQKHLLSGSANAGTKAAELRAKLAPNLGKFGLIGLIVGIWMIIANILFMVV
ncbi:hypothetical protein RYH73_17140 [Olivibacter sp. CPCC 100613]|uniref:hypothetical protein n=1 Tax=Olivibacter sp. CPCC 100613 TaxID=3079931 RepID=UPI002FF5E56C